MRSTCRELLVLGCPAVYRSLPRPEQLELGEIPSGFDPEEFDLYADRFYAEVLPRHAATLTQLSIDSSRQGRWTVNAHSVKAILPFRARLTHPTILLNLPDEENNFLDEERKQVGLRAYNTASALLFRVSIRLRHGAGAVAPTPIIVHPNGMPRSHSRSRIIVLTMKRAVFRLYLEHQLQYSYHLALSEEDVWQFAAIGHLPGKNFACCNLEDTVSVAKLPQERRLSVRQRGW
ncbi:hypothetical protein B0H19DRAFT_1230124 [Mycena capillaripes]|nr:hypothetical protein B0H19DRAFT_1230124 [Mycena capillaripes]